MGDSGDYIFAKKDDGSLEFKGDFEGLYKADPDPWGQSGEHPRMKEYYSHSRALLEGTLLGLIMVGVKWARALEVGCGAGHVVDRLEKRFPHLCVVHGCDVSHSAIGRARQLHPTRFFYQLDIADPSMDLLPRWGTQSTYDVVILSQILWYVLHHLPVVFNNCGRLLNPGGHLIIQTAFLDNQEYGREIVDGFNGLLAYVLQRQAANFQIVSASYDNSSQYAPHHDGLLALQKLEGV